MVVRGMLIKAARDQLLKLPVIGTPKASQNGITMGLLMTRIGRIKLSDYHRPREPRHKHAGSGRPEYFVG